LLEQRQQQTPGDGQADALRLGRGGEAGEVVRIEGDGLPELLAEAVALGAEAVVVLGQLLQLLSVLGAVQGLHDPGGAR
jgi:hypothetical protein